LEVLDVLIWIGSGSGFTGSALENGMDEGGEEREGLRVWWAKEDWDLTNIQYTWRVGL
jgi:hypothetical protein